MRPREHRLSHGGGFSDLPGALQRLCELSTDEIGVPVTGWKQLDGAAKELYRDRGCSRGRLHCRLPQPVNCIEITLLGTQQHVTCHLRHIGPGTGKCRSGVPVQRHSHRDWQVFVDRLLHELMSEDDCVGTFIQESGSEGLGQVGHDVHSGSASHGSQVPDRDGFTEQRCKLKPVEGSRREVSKTAKNEIAERAWQLVTNSVHNVRISLQPPFRGERADQFHEQERIASRLVDDRAQEWSSATTQLAVHQSVDISRFERPQLHHPRSCRGTFVDQHIELRRTRCRPQGRHDQQRDVDKVVQDRLDGAQTRLVGPVQVLQHQDDWSVQAHRLEQVGHRVHDHEPRIDGRRRAPQFPLAENQAANAGPSRVSRPGPELERIDKRTEGSISLKGMRCAAQGGGADDPPFGGNALDQQSLADPGLTLDQEGSGRSATQRADQLSANRQLGLSTNKVISRR